MAKVELELTWTEYWTALPAGLAEAPHWRVVGQDPAQVASASVTSTGTLGAVEVVLLPQGVFTFQAWVESLFSWQVKLVLERLLPE